MTFLVVAILYAAQDVFVPIALAVLFAFLLTPVCEALENRGIKRPIAVVSSAVMSLAILIGLGAFVWTEANMMLDDVPQFQAEAKEKLSGLAKFNSTFGGRLESWLEGVEMDVATAEADSTAAKEPGLGSLIPGATPERPMFTRMVKEGSTLTTKILPNIAVVLGPIGTAGLVVVFALFLLMYRDDLQDRVVYLFSRGGDQVITTNALRDSSERISRYILAQSMLNTGYGIAIAIGLAVIGWVSGRDGGFPTVALWALLCAVLRFVPYIGPFIAASFPLIVSLAAFPGYKVFIAVIALIIVVELISNNVLEPWVYGSSTGLSPLAVILAAVFWSWLWGPLGLLLSTPLTVCLVSFGNHIRPLQIFPVLLGDEGSLSAPIRLYQRLLNGDAIKARRLIDSEIERFGLTEAVDTCLLPAIRKMRRDQADDKIPRETRSEFSAAARELLIWMAADYPDDDGEREDGPSESALQLRRDNRPELTVTAGGRSAADDAEKSIGGAESPAFDDGEGDEEGVAPARPVVLLIPTLDEIEEQVLRLVARQFTEVATCEVMSARRLPSEIKRRVAEFAPVVVVIGQIPPGGILQRQFILRQIKEAGLSAEVVYCYYGRVRRYDKMMQQMLGQGVTQIATSFQQTLRSIQNALAQRVADVADSEGVSRVVELERTEPRSI